MASGRIAWRLPIEPTGGCLLLLAGACAHVRKRKGRARKRPAKERVGILNKKNALHAHVEVIAGGGSDV